MNSLKNRVQTKINFEYFLISKSIDPKMYTIIKKELCYRMTLL